ITDKVPKEAGSTSLPVIIDNRTYLLGTYNSDMAGIYRSTDAGETWTRISSGGMLGPPTIGYDGTMFWAHDRSGGVRSMDKGATWTELGNNPQMGTRVVELPDHRLISVWDRRIQISTDRGATWRNFGPTLAWEGKAIVYSTYRKAIYVSHFGCGNGSVPIEADQIVRLDFDYTKG